jgi:DNA (cytosine-5)-methyltransferase 1
MDGADSINEPSRTLDATNCRLNAIAQPVLVPFSGERSGEEPRSHSVTEPSLIEMSGELYFPDIRFRMLAPKELAQIMGFPSGYKFFGSKADITRQIGNAVQVDIAEAISTAILRQIKGARQ